MAANDPTLEANTYNSTLTQEEIDVTNKAQRRTTRAANEPHGVRPVPKHRRLDRVDFTREQHDALHRLGSARLSCI
jgi:hypothetical protein